MYVFEKASEPGRQHLYTSIVHIIFGADQRSATQAVNLVSRMVQREQPTPVIRCEDRNFVVNRSNNLGRLTTRDPVNNRLCRVNEQTISHIRQPDLVHWYRWNEDTDTWAAQSGQVVGRGWFDVATSARSNACQRVGTTVPAQPNGPVTLLGTSDGHVHLSYVDSEGRAAHAEAADLTGGTPIGVSVVPGFLGVTATTATGEYQDGRVALLATGPDADTRESIRGTNDVWSAPTNEGGWLSTPPSVVRMAGDVLAAYAVDASYNLWTRRQPAANAPLSGWRLVAASPFAHQRLTVLPSGAGVRVIGLGHDGQFRTATIVDGVRWAWGTIAGTGFTGTASAVVMPDSTLQLFAVDNTGTVKTQRQATVGSWPGWTALSGVTAAGNPSAIMAPDGTLQVVVRGTDNYVYYSGQTAPGASTWTPWRTVTTSEETSTDPTALAVPSASTWVVAYVNDVGVPKLRRYQPPVPARGAGFTDLPIM
jgi:hypothetical protein